MRKAALCLTFLILLTCSGCAADLSHDEFYSYTLTITNNSPHPITDITVTHDGQEAGRSPRAIQDAHSCIFSLAATSAQAHAYTYTVSFRDPEGEEHSKTFTGEPAEYYQAFLAVEEQNGVWSIDYDTAAAQLRGR